MITIVVMMLMRMIIKVAVSVCRHPTRLITYAAPGRDLKPQNVLLDETGVAKVCDFGISRFKDRTFLSTKNVNAGTPAYMSPEQFEGRPVGEKVDVFAFGVILWEMLTGQQPWAELEHPMQIVFVVGVQGQRLPLPEDCPPALAALIPRCWHEEPAERPSFRELQHVLQQELDRAAASS